MADRRADVNPGYEPPRVDDLGTLDALTAGASRGAAEGAQFSKS